MGRGSSLAWLAWPLAAAGLVLVGWSVVDVVGGAGGPLPVAVAAAGGAFVALALGLGVWGRRTRESIASHAAVAAGAERYRRMFESNRAMALLVDPATERFVDVNPAAAEFYGYSRERLRQMSLGDVSLAPSERRAELTRRATSESVTFTSRHRLASGEVRDVEVHTGPIELEGRILLYTIMHDVTDRKRVEQDVRQAEKLEALGRLAGGVAHDFSNILMVMMGHASLAVPRLPENDPSRRRFEEIMKAGERAATLTGRLLSFARRQVLVTGPLDLNAALRDMEDLVRRLVGEDVEVVLDLAEGLPAVEVDTSQITEIVMNLAANGRDAMPKGGRLTLATRDPHKGEDGAPRPPSSGGGPYVLFIVADTGEGMTPDAMEHLFEPFFTTKERGHGVGLGLATVYGIVSGSGGLVQVESPPGRGTTVSLWLPQAPADARAALPLEPAGAIRGGSETVLLVEDEAEIRSSLRAALGDHGYSVVLAGDGEEALRVAQGLGRPIHLLVTDVVMPRLGGGELARRLTAEDPSLRVLYISGYSDDDLVRRGVSREDRGFLAKPFTPDVFLRKVRDVLDARGGQ